VETVSAPCGPLALTATHWIEDRPEGRLPDIPGNWLADKEGVVLTATDADGLTVAGRPFSGETRPAADTGPEAGARVALGAKRLVVLVREGVWGVRVYDPESAPRRAFRGIDADPFDPRWSVPGRFTPYDGTRTVRLGNADGRERGFELAGDLAFSLAGRERGLKVARWRDGSLWAVFADATSGDTSFRFRFALPARPGRRGPDDRRLHPCPAPAVRLRRPLHLPLPSPRQHAGRAGRGGGAPPERAAPVRAGLSGC
jgi:uncharacterized protein (DUF1684 family)